ncbi:MAG: hypothetical protein J5742_03135 [Alphaproteobacteria bacterium]|nr:hypothetical protein [Alphaproteobacteria bacterium]
MKKILSFAVAAAALTTSAVAAQNMENPLFLPSGGEVYSKTSFGLMLKITDSTDSQVLRDHDGATEFPIWRPVQELGLGITDRWAVNGVVGYTYDVDIDRKGFHLGRLGTTYRIFDDMHSFIWDVYGDLHMGGIEKMKGSLGPSPVDPSKYVFNYDNYSNGRWGMHVGTKFGKTWERLTTSAFVEVLRTWGNHNNEIDVSALGLPGIPDKMSVDIKSTWEVNAGANIFYQMTDRWSGGLTFNYKYHATNGLEGIHTDISAAPAPVQAGLKHMLDEYKDMEDHFNEYALMLTLAYQFRDGMQVAWYIEDTLDTAARLSANTTDLKVETGFRLNLKF